MLHRRLTARIEADGQWLFRWRSFAPLILTPVALVALAEAAKLESRFGDAYDQAWFLACLALSLSGLAIRWATVGFAPAGTSGRNTRGQRAEVLNTTGLYSLVRNPLYLGNFVAIIGVVMAMSVWWYVAIASLAYWLYIERVIAAEEAYLAGKFGRAYDDWMARTPAFLPKLSGWRSPTAAFSVRTVLRREYNGVMAIATAFLVQEAVLDLWFEHESLGEWLVEDRAWVMVFAIAAATFAVLRTLKKHTRLLHVPGR
ncbi:MAG: isoprenylcysteine carboxylmethyltransferase family protein [Alphaproteobacteria bacterium]